MRSSRYEATTGIAVAYRHRLATSAMTWPSGAAIHREPHPDQAQQYEDRRRRQKPGGDHARQERPDCGADLGSGRPGRKPCRRGADGRGNAAAAFASIRCRRRSSTPGSPARRAIRGDRARRSGGWRWCAEAAGADDAGHRGKRRDVLGVVPFVELGLVLGHDVHRVEQEPARAFRAAAWSPGRTWSPSKRISRSTRLVTRFDHGDRLAPPIAW